MLSNVILETKRKQLTWIVKYLRTTAGAILRSFPKGGRIFATSGPHIQAKGWNDRRYICYLLRAPNPKESRFKALGIQCLENVP